MAPLDFTIEGGGGGATIAAGGGAGVALVMVLRGRQSRCRTCKAQT